MQCGIGLINGQDHAVLKKINVKELFPLASPANGPGDNQGGATLR
jgi:hypothetical protein